MDQSLSIAARSPKSRRSRWRLRGYRKTLLGVAASMAVLCAGVTASALTPAEPLPVSDAIALDGQNSAFAARLVDGTTAPTAADSWANATNPWQDSFYPMTAVIDLGADYDLSSVRYFAGQIPFPSTALLSFDSASAAEPDNFVGLTTAQAPRYGQWSPLLSVTDTRARYVRVRFDSAASHFNLAEVQVFGRPAGLEPENNTSTDTNTDTGPSTYLSGLTVVDEDNSSHADRLVDAVNPPGTTSAVSWTNPSPWNSSNYPMSAVIDLGGTYSLDKIEYFVGEISQGQDKVNFEYANQPNPAGFVPLVSADSGHRWNKWRSISLDGEQASYLRVRFDSPAERFNISEIRIQGSPVAVPTTSPGSDVISGNQTDSPDTDVPDTETPNTETPSTETPNTEVPDTGDGHGGHGGMEDSTLDDIAVNEGDLPSSDTPVLDVTEDLPQATVPPAGVERSFQFGVWPSDHLSASCKELHDRFWVVAPDGVAYPTWHPALIVHPETGERCDIGHEHGTDPSASPLFAKSGGWPAFGFAAAAAAVDGSARHEDHPGYKMSVAHFRAAIGNGGGSKTMYDAGFECDWLSMIHQGSFSMDAFANHLHQYSLTVGCLDGLNSAGVMDGKTVGTDFSVKVVYTYGKPNEFVEKSCSGADETFSSSILTGPEGQPAPAAMQLTPIGLDSPNNRGFSCASGVIWKPMSEVREVDLWTELVKIQRGDGHTALTIQPYYQIKNPARIIAPYDRELGEKPSQVVRTISLCYDDNGAKINKYKYCADAPDTEPADWRDPSSPFNGSLRAINFKASSLNNAGGPAEFCTNAFGRTVQDTPPCGPGHILQRASSFNNNWNNGEYSFGGNTGHVAGSIWAENPHGDRFGSEPNGSGGYNPAGIGFEFIVDNRNPDDNFDGVPDGANIRGQN